MNREGAKFAKKSAMICFFTCRCCSPAGEKTNVLPSRPWRLCGL